MLLEEKKAFMAKIDKDHYIDMDVFTQLTNLHQNDILLYVCSIDNAIQRFMNFDFKFFKKNKKTLYNVLQYLVNCNETILLDYIMNQLITNDIYIDYFGDLINIAYNRSLYSVCKILTKYESKQNFFL